MDLKFIYYNRGFGVLGFYAAADLRLGHKNALEIRVHGRLFFRGHGGGC